MRRPRLQLAVERFEPREDTAQTQNRVLPLRRPAAVRRPPRTSTPTHAKPLCAIAIARSVGSVTTAASARQLCHERVGADARVLFVHDGGDDEATVREPPLARACAAASIIAATPPFMSCEPRP